MIELITASDHQPIATDLISLLDQNFKLDISRQLFDLAKFCRKNIKPRAVFEDGRKSIILAEGAMNSIKSKKVEKLIY